MKKFVEEKMTYLVSARPTAVNIVEAGERLIRLSSKSVSSFESAATAKEKLVFKFFLFLFSFLVFPFTIFSVVRILRMTKSMLEEDINTNKAMAAHGAKHLLNLVDDKAVTVLTHCNTGSLATAGYGTALGSLKSFSSK